MIVSDFAYVCIRFPHAFVGCAYAFICVAYAVYAMRARLCLFVSYDFV